jgi:hypothetical protein
MKRQVSIVLSDGVFVLSNVDLVNSCGLVVQGNSEEDVITKAEKANNYINSIGKFGQFDGIEVIHRSIFINEEFYKIQSFEKN